MTKEYKTIQIRRDTLSDFASRNPILASGEPAIAIDAKVFKIGDGATRWNSLDSLSTQSFVEEVSGFLSNKISNEIAALIDGAPSVLDTLNELAAAINDDANFASTFISSGTQFVNALNLTSGILQSQITNAGDNNEYSSGIAVFASGEVIDIRSELNTTNSNFSIISGIADFASGQFPINFYDLENVRGPLGGGEENFYFPYISALSSGSINWTPRIVDSNNLIYATGTSVERSITEAIRTVSGVAISSGDNISLLNNDVNYIVSDTSAASGSDIVENIISLTQSEYDLSTPESGIFYIITDASGTNGINSLLEDATPQLGGNLDINNNNIIGTGNLNINGSGNFTSGVYNNGSPVVKSDIGGISGNVSGVNNLVIVDQVTFDNISTKDPNTIYYIL
jgi:hypothetical protein